jgi:hypothetical protein
VNTVPELHPHEWVPAHEEVVWQFDDLQGKFTRNKVSVVVHITHNGDFDALEAYSQTMVVDEVGCWLERVLHVPNNLKGDSPKIAGCMDLLRVQGRWAAAARLSWVRSVLSSSKDVCGGEILSKSAPNTFPGSQYWNKWAEFLDEIWRQHVNNVIQPVAPLIHEIDRKYAYEINSNGVKQFVANVCLVLTHEHLSKAYDLGVDLWSSTKLHAFIYYTVSGFLKGDLYTSMTEFLSRADGSFGIQVHCSIEPGVVVIASKGQPMSIAFDPKKPICLFASEAEALAVPVFDSGKWLPERFDLDSHGEIVRIGAVRALLEGSYSSSLSKNSDMHEFEITNDKLVRFNNVKRPTNNTTNQVGMTFHESDINRQDCLLLSSGIEIRSYSIISSGEASFDQLIDRCVSIKVAPVPYDPSVDLVSQDLKVSPAVLAAIDKGNIIELKFKMSDYVIPAWSNSSSIEYITGKSLSENLVACMRQRLSSNSDTTDLLIGGVEISLWLAEQFAADLRSIFPSLNVLTASANKFDFPCIYFSIYHLH